MKEITNWHPQCNWVQAVKARHNKLINQPSKFKANFPKLQLTPTDHPHNCQNMPLLSCSCILYMYNIQMMDLINPQTLLQTKQIGAITNTTVIAHVQRRGIFLKKSTFFHHPLGNALRRMAKWTSTSEQNFQMRKVHHLIVICGGTAVCKSPLVSRTRKEGLLRDLG